MPKNFEFIRELGNFIFEIAKPNPLISPPSPSAFLCCPCITQNSFNKLQIPRKKQKRQKYFAAFALICWREEINYQN